MATTTTRLQLKKPAQTDFYNIDDHNENSDKIDAFSREFDDTIINLASYLSDNDSRIETIQVDANALKVRVTNTEAKNSAQDTNIGNLQAETVKLRTDFTNADASLKTQLTTAFTAADTTLNTNLTNAYKAADTAQGSQLTTDYKAADVVVTNAYKAADTTLNTNLTNAYKAADTDITSKAQMHKITSDAGGPITLGNLTFAEFLAANPYALRSFYTNTTIQTDAPTTVRGLIANTGANTGTGYHWGFGIDYSRNMWVTHASSSEPTKVLWDRMAKASELDAKAAVSKAQMVKVTDDAGGSIYEATTGSLTDFIKGLPLGYHTVFIANTVTGRPPGSTDLRGVIFKIGSNNATYVYGVNVIWLYSSNAGGVASNWSGQLYGGAEPNEAQWNFLKDSKNAAFGGTAVPANTLGADGDIYVQYI